MSEDAILVLMAAGAKDKAGIERRFEEYGVNTAAELLPLLPKHVPTPLRTRILNWLRRMEGTQAGDPNRPKPERKPYFAGYKLTKLKR